MKKYFTRNVENKIFPVKDRRKNQNASENRKRLGKKPSKDSYICVFEAAPSHESTAPTMT